MAGTIQGFGTSFVGQRDFGRDGSYVTTEWVMLLFVPVVPLRSLRVSETTKDETQAPIHSKQSYLVHRELPIHRQQVLYVYGFLVCYIGLCILTASVSGFLPDRIAEAVLVVVIFVIPWFVPWYLRSRAKRRIGLGTQK